MDGGRFRSGRFYAGRFSGKKAGVPPVPSAPTNLVAPGVTPTSGEVGDLLTCDDGIWSGYPTPVITRQWVRGASNVGDGGNTQATFNAGDFHCLVTATNSVDSVQVSSNVVTINEAAAVSAAAVVLGTAENQIDLEISLSPINGTGTFYQYTNTEAATPDDATIKANAQQSVANVALSSSIPGPTTPSFATAYFTHIHYDVPGVGTATFTVATPTAAEDITDPVLTGLSLDIIDETTLQVLATVDKPVEVLWNATLTTDDLDESQIENGLTHLSADSVAHGAFVVLAAGDIQFNAPGLSEVDHTIHIVARDRTVNPNSSGILKATAQPRDVEPPIMTNLVATADNENTLSWLANTDEAGGSIFVIGQRASIPVDPSLPQIKAGLDANGVACAAGTFAVTAAGAQGGVLSATPEGGNEDYALFAVHEDGAAIPNTSLVLRSVNEATTPDPNIYSRFGYDGTNAGFAQVNGSVFSDAHAGPDGNPTAFLWGADGVDDTPETEEQVNCWTSGNSFVLAQDVDTHLRFWFKPMSKVTGEDLFLILSLGNFTNDNAEVSPAQTTYSQRLTIDLNGAAPVIGTRGPIWDFVQAPTITAAANGYSLFHAVFRAQQWEDVVGQFKIQMADTSDSTTCTNDVVPDFTLAAAEPGRIIAITDLHLSRA